MGRPRIVVVVGLPGSGKSTWLAGRGMPALSSDEIRRVLTDDATDQTIQRRVFAVLRYLLRQRLDIGKRLTCIDATNLTRRERRPYLRIARLRNCVAEALFFDIPLEICLRRNRARDRVVPDAVLRRMAAKLEPPSRAEGFARVVRVSASSASSGSSRRRAPGRKDR